MCIVMLGFGWQVAEEGMLAIEEAASEEAQDLRQELEEVQEQANQETQGLRKEIEEVQGKDKEAQGKLEEVQRKFEEAQEKLEEAQGKLLSAANDVDEARIRRSLSPVPCQTLNHQQNPMYRSREPEKWINNFSSPHTETRAPRAQGIPMFNDSNLVKESIVLPS